MTNLNHYEESRDLHEMRGHSRLDAGSDMTTARQHLTFFDTVILAAFAVGGYVIATNFGETSWIGFHAGEESQPARQQLCNDEELRQMRSGPETCYVPAGPDRESREFDKPDLRKPASS